MDIKAWIINPNRSYKDGLSIYHKHKRNKNKDTFFNSVSDAPKESIHMNLLLQEIKTAFRISLANSQAQPIQKPLPGKPITTKKLLLGDNISSHSEASQSTNPKYVFNDIVDVKSLPEDLQKLYFRNQEITRKLSGIHQQLKAAFTDEARALAAAQIDSLFVERKANWWQIDSFANAQSPQTPHDLKAKADTLPDKDNHFTQPAINKQLAREMLEAQKRLKTVKINISRVEKELANTSLTPSKVKSRSARLKVWKSEMDDLQSQLSTI